MKILSLSLLCIFHWTSDPVPEKLNELTTTSKDTVYICGSGKGRKYHLTEHCRGLSNCSTKTVKTTLKQATKEGKTLCGWEK